MVKRLVARALLLLWAAGAAAVVDPEFVSDSYEDGANTQKPRPYKRSPVVSVVIKENAAKSLPGQDTPDDCSRFVVTAAQVKQYYARARPVSKRAHSHELDWSPCVANGRLKLADGRSARWGVQQYGLGWLYIHHRLYYFHCEKCKLVQLVP